MSSAVQTDPDLLAVTVDLCAVERGPRHTVRRVYDIDVIPARSDLDRRLETRPSRREARINDDEVSLAADAENAFDARTVHPGRRSGVPGPAPAPDMRCY